MSATYFVEHTLGSAPDRARATMQAVESEFGFLPGPVALMSTSPELLLAFTRANALFGQTTLSPLAREVAILTIVVHNDCHICISMHASALLRLGDTQHLADALREQRQLPNPELEALRIFTLAVLANAGKVSDHDLQRFIDAGYTAKNALEVVLGVGTYTLSTFANRMTTRT